MEHNIDTDDIENLDGSDIEARIFAGRHEKDIAGSRSYLLYHAVAF